MSTTKSMPASSSPEDILDWLTASAPKERDTGLQKHSSQLVANTSYKDIPKVQPRRAPRRTKRVPGNRSQQHTTPPQKLQKPPSIPINQDNLCAKGGSCRKIIEHLFFSKTRTDIYLNKMNTMQADLIKKMKSYYSAVKYHNHGYCKLDAFIHFVTIYNSHIRIEEDQGERVVYRTPALPYSKEIVDVITEHVMIQWKILCESPWGQSGNNRSLDFDDHVLAILNHMKKGGASFCLENNSMKVIPGLAYVAKYFPPINDIELFGYEKNAITTGTGNLTGAYHSINTGSSRMPIDTLFSVNTKVVADDTTIDPNNDDDTTQDDEAGDCIMEDGDNSMSEYSPQNE